MSEMKACPFCGSQPELMEGHSNHWRVECPKCGVRRAQFANGGVEEDKARAIACWNRRAEPSTRTPASCSPDVVSSNVRSVAKRERANGNAEIAGVLDEAADALESMMREKDAMVEWAFEKSSTFHRLAHDDEHLRTEYIASSTAYRELALELKTRAALTGTTAHGEDQEGM